MFITTEKAHVLRFGAAITFEVSDDTARLLFPGF